MCVCDIIKYLHAYTSLNEYLHIFKILIVKLIFIFR